MPVKETAKRDRKRFRTSSVRKARHRYRTRFRRWRSKNDLRKPGGDSWGRLLLAETGWGCVASAYLWAEKEHRGFCTGGPRVPWVARVRLVPRLIMPATACGFRGFESDIGSSRWYPNEWKGVNCNYIYRTNGHWHSSHSLADYCFGCMISPPS